MTKFARIAGDTVAELVTVPAELNLADLYHPELAATFVACPAEVAVGWTFNGTQFAAPTAPAPDLKARAAARRWQVETGGITFGGLDIATDLQSQARLTGLFALAQANPEATIPFKAVSGFVTLDAGEAADIALAVGDHVQACFAAERAVLADIDAGAVTSAAEVDAHEAWP